MMGLEQVQGGWFTVNQTDKQPETSRVGTWVSVSIVGAVIFLTYVIVFGLYMARV
jgi:hypothetical protein